MSKTFRRISAVALAGLMATCMTDRQARRQTHTSVRVGEQPLQRWRCLQQELLLQQVLTMEVAEYRFQFPAITMKRIL